MKRDIDAGFFLIVAIMAYGFMAMLNIRPAHSEPSRLYPYMGTVYRMEDGLSPRMWAEVGSAYSLGPLAPSVTLQAPLSGKFAPAVEVRVRVKL